MKTATIYSRPIYRESRRQMLLMSIGATRAIFDRVVTRWSENFFEVDTWGRDHYRASFIAMTIATEK